MNIEITALYFSKAIYSKNIYVIVLNTLYRVRYLPALRSILIIINFRFLKNYCKIIEISCGSLKIKNLGSNLHEKMRRFTTIKSIEMLKG